MTLTETPKLTVGIADIAWPPEVDIIISAMQVGQGAGAHDDRRQLARTPFRAGARLRLFSDEHGTAPRVLYTCDVNQRSLGFIAPSRLPLSHGGILEIVSPDDRLMSIHCTLCRCSEVAPGWYRGALFFNRAQLVFTPGRRSD